MSLSAFQVLPFSRRLLLRWLTTPSYLHANPTPEVDPDIARKYARVVATGCSDYPDQINNVLAFLGIFQRCAGRPHNRNHHRKVPGSRSSNSQARI